MKKISICWMVLGLTISSLASADENWTQNVVTHPVVIGLQQLMNAKYGQTCIAPKSSDVRAECTGALPDPTTPTIASVPCFFQLKVICQGGSVQVSGTKQLYELVVPQDGHPQVTQSTPETIVFDQVQFN